MLTPAVILADAFFDVFLFLFCCSPGDFWLSVYLQVIAFAWICFWLSAFKICHLMTAWCLKTWKHMGVSCIYWVYRALFSLIRIQLCIFVCMHVCVCTCVCACRLAAEKPVPFDILTCLVMSIIIPRRLMNVFLCQLVNKSSDWKQQTDLLLLWVNFWAAFFFFFKLGTAWY